MPITIKHIQKRSIAYDLPIKKGFDIISIDSKPINDILDLIFFSQNDKFTLEYADLNKQVQKCKVMNTFDKPLGIEVDLPTCVSCVNNCIFCFINQMPPNLRASLYVKDDDFLYSFFYGNFITLTNLTKRDLKKIISQRISPLYISVHTTNNTLHSDMMRYKHDFSIIDILKLLESADIELHTQIVLMPNINDGLELQNTLNHLIEMENVVSIGLVPVGLTRFKVCNSKFDVRKYEVSEAENLISEIDTFKTEKDIDHIYLADEFYLMAGITVPEEDYYHDYVQIENGIGMVRQSYQNWSRIKKKFLKFITSYEKEIVFVTSVSGEQAIKPIIYEINKSLINKQVKLYVIKNYFFGDEVTVTGLLTWHDIISQIAVQKDDVCVLSSGIFNSEMLTLDDVCLDDIRKELGCDLIVMNELFVDWKAI